MKSPAAIIQKFTLILLGIFCCLSCQDPLSEELQSIQFEDAKSETSATTNQTVTFVDSNGNPVSAQCVETTFPGGEIYYICVPENWNGDLVVYAHGYVSIFEPLSLPGEIDDILPAVVSQGYAFATTSLKVNGLAIQSGITDILELKDYFVTNYSEPELSYLAGGSQGGIITTLLLERFPEEFDGGLSLCGPCGDFQKQLNHYADFRLLFEYFFPGLFPQDIENDFRNVPMTIIDNWETVYVPQVIATLSANPAKVQKLLKIGKVPIDKLNPANLENSIGEAIISTLWYYFFTLENSIDILDGLAYDNTNKVYIGTGSFWDDLKINKKIIRVSGDPVAFQNVQNDYETSGIMDVPLVMMHTTLDPIQLFWHQQLYTLKALSKHRLINVRPIKVERFGHCTFTDEELLDAFTRLVIMVEIRNLLSSN